MWLHFHNDLLNRNLSQGCDDAGPAACRDDFTAAVGRIFESFAKAELARGPDFRPFGERAIGFV